jgi:hypothetical protein
MTNQTISEKLANQELERLKENQQKIKDLKAIYDYTQ